MTVDDWTDNTTWFDIKLLVDVQSGDSTKSMRKDTYAKHLKSVLQRLGMTCKKILHLGRNLDAKIPDLLQEEDAAIDAMGQWAPSIRRTCYSSQLPMGPIKKMAGFEEGAFYSCQRGNVEPPDELQRMTPIGQWCYDALRQLRELEEAGKHQTAIRFLMFMCRLNDIWLQDCAAMLLLHPEHASHPMFQDFVLFDTLPWERFKEKMKHELENHSTGQWSKFFQGCKHGKEQIWWRFKPLTARLTLW